jgi:hemolysin D
MTIVPADSPIEISALVRNQDIGFVESGQDAVVKIEAFPFTRYGTIEAKVLKVSREAVEETSAASLNDPVETTRPHGASPAANPLAPGKSLVYPATLALARRAILVDGREVALAPGMTVTVEIKTGARRAIDYLLSPLREVQSGSGHER